MSQRRVRMTCIICGGVLPNKRSKYCSSKCGDAAEVRVRIARRSESVQVKHGRAMRHQCIVCGATIPSGKMYCSRDCELTRQKDVYGGQRYTIRELLEMERGA